MRRKSLPWFFVSVPASLQFAAISEIRFQYEPIFGTELPGRLILGAESTPTNCRFRSPCPGIRSSGGRPNRPPARQSKARKEQRARPSGGLNPAGTAELRNVQI